MLADYLGPGRIAFVEWPPDAEPEPTPPGSPSPSRTAGAICALVEVEEPPRCGSGDTAVIVLGIDTATSATAVALRLADGTVSEARDDPPAGAHPGHATRLLGMAAELLDGAGISSRELRPASAGRIRAGFVHGSARGRRDRTRARAVSGGRARSRWEAWPRSRNSGPSGHPLLPVIDARRGEVFFAAPFASPAGPQLAPAAVLAPARIGELAGEDAMAVGDGAKRYRLELEAAGLEVPPARLRSSHRWRARLRFASSGSSSIPPARVGGTWCPTTCAGLTRSSALQAGGAR